MKFEVSAKGMATRNDGGQEMSFFTPGKQRLCGGSKEAVAQEWTFMEELSKL